ncbi:hypothetical protein P167DRAFT_535408 [Morchella conica CCBAS932]|uniref:Uncharacterized protein n=1 Tax=Morchella conica CCBAS932 TaxID=1392247 RepID=A0A3N4KUS5_9PEZI|nr:hypothetical protein P167DRAFT_535408 [Morchella conica CCBAS932]
MYVCGGSAASSGVHPPTNQPQTLSRALLYPTSQPAKSGPRNKHCQLRHPAKPPPHLQPRSAVLRKQTKHYSSPKEK